MPNIAVAAVAVAADIAVDTVAAVDSQDNCHEPVKEEAVAALVLAREAFHTEPIHRTWETVEEVVAWMERIGAVDGAAMGIVAADDYYYSWEVSNDKPSAAAAVNIVIVAWLEDREAAVDDWQRTVEASNVPWNSVAVVAELHVVVEPEEEAAFWQRAVPAANTNHPMPAVAVEAETHSEAVVVVVVRFENNSAEAAVEEVETAWSSLESSFQSLGKIRRVKFEKGPTGNRSK